MNDKRVSYVSLLHEFFRMFGGAIAFSPSVFAPTFKKQKNRKTGSRYMNQRQLRKRAAQGGVVRQESRLKQRRA